MKVVGFAGYSGSAGSTMSTFSIRLMTSRNARIWRFPNWTFPMCT